jgi:hypothetical protein
MTRGLKSVWYRRGLLNPFKYGVYSLMVVSHKLCRWLVPVALVVATAAAVGLAIVVPQAWPLPAAAVVVGLLAALGWMWPDEARAPKVLTVPAYVLIANMAALHGWVNLILGRSSAAWSPTRRKTTAEPTMDGSRPVDPAQ